jgi:hypothetical protein
MASRRWCARLARGPRSPARTAVSDHRRSPGVRMCAIRLATGTLPRTARIRPRPEDGGGDGGDSPRPGPGQRPGTHQRHDPLDRHDDLPCDDSRATLSAGRAGSPACRVAGTAPPGPGYASVTHQSRSEAEDPGGAWPGPLEGMRARLPPGPRLRGAPPGLTGAKGTVRWHDRRTGRICRRGSALRGVGPRGCGRRGTAGRGQRG